MIVNNSFRKGINQDLSKTSPHNETCVEIENFRLTTDEGLSTFALNNLKGTSLCGTIPNTYPIYKIQITTPGSCTIVIDGTPASAVYTSSTTSGLELYNFIINDMGLIAAGVGTTINVQYDADFVVVWSDTFDVATVSSGGGNPATVTQLVPAQTNLKVIGFGTIRDTIVLFTTNDSSSIGGVGQIWSATYEKLNGPVTLDLQLKYNGNLNFTSLHPIVNEAKGNYENINTQKIYWTDNFNSIRYCNIVDPNLMAKSINDFNFAGSAIFDKLVLKKITDDNGTLDTGSYQFFYRYKDLNGTTTNYSIGSDYVNITYIPEVNQTDINTYYEDRTFPTAKSITVQLDNIDSNKDIIEFVAVFYDNFGNLLSSSIFYSTAVSSTGSITATLKNMTDGISIDASSIVETNVIVEKAKTIEIKDSRLIAANITEKTFNLDFDARAYRFPVAGATIVTLGGKVITFNGISGYWNNTLVKDIVGNYTVVDSGTYALDETHDAINPAQKPEELGVSADPNFKFKKDGKTIGGEGLNVSYTFTMMDNLTSNQFQGDSRNAAGGSTFNLRNTTIYTSDTVSDVLLTGRNSYYPENTSRNFNSPYIQESLKAYQHLEYYRFALVFFDDAGRKSDAKWIADIRMPSWFERTVPSVQEKFPLTELNTTTNIQSIKLLGLTFTVNNLNTLPDNIVGFSIMRVKRINDDRSIIASGIIQYSDFNLFDYYCTNNPGLSNYITLEGLDQYYHTGVSYKPGDILYTVGGLQTPGSYSSAIGSKLIANKPYVTAPYAYISGTFQANPIDDSKYVDSGNSFGALPDFRNAKFNTGVLDTQPHVASIVMKFDTPINPEYSGSDFTYGYYYQDILSTQYGGQSYFARSTNLYESIGDYTIIDNNATKTTNVLGGDRYINIWDYIQYKAEIDDPGGPGLPTYFRGVVNFLPIESVVNYEWHTNTNTPNRYSINLEMPSSAMPNPLPSGSNQQAICPEIRIENITSQLPIPFESTTSSNVYDNRIYASEFKINGESGESWSIFKVNNFNDVDSIYGPINKIINFEENLYFIQDKAFGAQPINLRSFISDNAGGQVSIGTGTVLTKHQYVTKESGSKHQFSVVVSNQGIYYYDVINKKLIQFSGGTKEISLLKGMDSFFISNLNGDIFSNDNVVKPTNKCGVIATKDYRHNEILFTFYNIDDKVPFTRTICWSETMQAFTASKYSFTPTIYINDKVNLFSCTTNQNIWQHNYGDYNNFYDALYPSKVKILTNDSPNITKTFNNLILQTECTVNNTQVGVTFDKVQCANDYQNTGVVDLITANLKRKERTWFTVVPRDLQNASFTLISKPRMRDKYMTTELTFTPLINVNRKFICNDIITSILESEHGYPKNQ